MLTNKKRFLSLRLLIPITLVIISFVLCIGYATVSDTLLNVGGNAVAMMQKGVFITDIQYKTGNSVNVDSSLLKVVRGTLLNSSIELSPTNSDSYITYTITFLNNDDYAYEFRKVVFDESFYDNSNIEVYLTDYTLPGTIIEKNGSLSIDIRFQYKSGVTASTLVNKLNAYVNLEFVPIAMLKATTYNDTTAFRNAAYKEKIKTITFEKGIGVPTSAVESWDIGIAQNGNVNAYLTTNNSDPNYYDLYIQSETQLYANENMRYWFQDFKNVDSINYLEYLDTSKTTNMSSMFESTGYNSLVFTLDVSGFDTSNVTDMSNMFDSTGYSSSVFTLDLRNFETSNVMYMSWMFAESGYSNTDFVLDVSNFDTSNVLYMSYMFFKTGYNNSSFTLDVSGFDTSNVVSMRGMFNQVGYYSTNFILDVSNFDTSNVTDMYDMFQRCGYNNSSFTLDVSGFDTSKVTNMGNMFLYTGYKSTILQLDVSEFDTSSVTDMSDMFKYAGYNNTNFVLDVSGFDTSNVTNMSYMFNYTGYKSKVFTLDVSNFNTSNVTDMMVMFFQAGYSSEVFELDVSNFNTSKVTSMNSMFGYAGYSNPNFTLDVSGFDTSKVSNFGSMFTNAGYINPSFTLDVSNFDTSSATLMFNMFYKTGYNSKNFTLDVSNFNTSKATDMSDMFYYVGYSNPDLILDLGNWDTRNVTDMSSMFAGSKVKTIYVSNKWNVTNVTSSGSMFSGCNNLVGGLGTTYTSSFTDKTYARIDGGTTSPGYFTLRPEGYRMLNYIESTGTQYIDTGFKPTSENFKVEMIYNQTKQPGNNSLFGNESNSSGRQWSIVSYRSSGAGFQSHWVGTTGNSHHITTQLNKIYNYTMHANNGTLTVTNDGDTTTTTYNGTMLKIHNIFIFANNIDGKAGQYSYMKLYSFKMYDNGNIARNFVPCKNSNGEVGLYDFVNNQFYGNSGTGTFKVE